ncbi:TetR/AcrR family transcriptional regulator [Pseudonocardia acaciae]|uniref:TetR/AcrR family transcriptional regulator n=1 Tax=Pseudonocardia acaciae TaxID=551276 RepID=UPI000B290C9D|nr:TetR/AcrR family transcriptional regulator [Pseudonocardia acaciae]
MFVAVFAIKEPDMPADQARPRRRQARGERRIGEILDAAGRVFARAGYEKATTNAIAAEAGISPGSLYQFFASKETIAHALADRFVTHMRAAHHEAFETTDFAAVTLDEAIDRIVDPIVAFNVANPGFKALFARPDMPPGLVDATEPIQSALLGRLRAMLAARNLPAAAQDRAAHTMIRVFQAMLAPIISADDAERPTAVTELKTVLRAYLAATLAQPTA